jgi:hypothetical protein
MTETLKLNDGTVLANSSAILSSDLFVYIRDSDLQTVFDLLIDPENTKKIIYTKVNSESVTFVGYKKLRAVTDEGNGLITAVLRKEVTG